MSLFINTDHVIRVLLADGWHDVVEDTFVIDGYEFAADGRLVHGSGQSGICASGFTFLETDGVHLAGPLTSVLAVATHRDEEHG